MGVWLSWLEHLPCKQGVIGSNPIISTKKKRPWVVFFVVEHGFERVQSHAFDFVKTTTPGVIAGARL